MIHSRTPGGALAPFVSRLWVSDGAAGDSHGAATERVLPTGATHLVLRLASEPLHLLPEGDATHAETVAAALVGGVRTGPYFKDVSRRVGAVGAVLEPGATRWLFGVPAHELAGHHTPLDALWGADAELLREELAEQPTPEARLASLERRLAERLPTLRGLHPGVAHALRCLDVRGERSIARAAEASGLGHRRFGSLFREAAGLPPKRWTRLRRFQRAVQRAAAEPGIAWADLALDLGYSDQPHFNREFREFAGLAPSEYRRLVQGPANHVPLPDAPESSRPARPARRRWELHEARRPR